MYVCICVIPFFPFCYSPTHCQNFNNPPSTTCGVISNLQSLCDVRTFSTILYVFSSTTPLGCGKVFSNAPPPPVHERTSFLALRRELRVASGTQFTFLLRVLIFLFRVIHNHNHNDNHYCCTASCVRVSHRAGLTNVCCFVLVS